MVIFFVKEGENVQKTYARKRNFSWNLISKFLKSIPSFLLFAYANGQICISYQSKHTSVEYKIKKEMRKNTTNYYAPVDL